MVLKDILSMEGAREDITSYRVIHLIREGTFLRAYEVSSWLFVRFIHEYKISNKMYKGHKEPVCMVGFPAAKLDALLTEPACKAFGTSKVDDTRVDILLTTEEIPDEYDAGLMVDDYSRWKKSLPVDTAKTVPSGDGPATEGPGGIMNAMRKVVSVPLETMSPLECQTFLFQLRAELVKFF